MTAVIERQLRDEFLNAMSRAASTVSVVTTDGPAGRFGTTISSMSSVSIDGERPLLMFCISENSSAAKPIIENGVFCINVLRDSQRDIADCFAGRSGLRQQEKFACTGWTVQKTGAPRIVDPLAAFDCRLEAGQFIGHHHVLFGAVEDIYVHPIGSPLLYSRRGYGRFSPF